ncbi:MAG: translation initiation factor IF-2 [Clostridiaceae bacterium]|jgi:translation initiation factor IF-2|nr:translation initiation factor IF-2 [Clostridiaceae bacterium]
MTDTKDKAGMKPEEGMEAHDKKQDISGPEIIVSGISGTKTLRVGRVNKKARPPKDEPTADEKTAVEAVAAPEIKSPPAEVKPEAEIIPAAKPVEPVAEEIPAVKNVKTETVSAVPAKTEVPPAAPVRTDAPKPAPAPQQTQRGPGGVVTTSRSTFIRPSGREGAYNSGTSQAPGYGQNRPRPGGYPPRRPAGPMGKDDDSQSRGPVGHRGPPKTDKPDLPPEITKEKANFAARDAFEKSRKDPAKDSKKDPGKPATAQTSRRADNMRVVNSAISGREANEILSDESTLEALYRSKPKGRRPASRKKGFPGQQQQQKAVLTHVQIPESITVKDFAEGIQKRSAEIIKKLMKLGVLATINQEIDFDTATLIAEEFGITTELLVEVTEEDILFDDTADTDENLQARPPVVVVMGHVDHGKTSLLDKIRSSSVVKGEAGGITQHIGAYTVRLKNRPITFLDTPGHEAFTTMRARGAQVTDIAILVVAADDGVMPQTVEAINHAKAANTEIVVAINKMDRPGANPDKVKQELSVHGVIPEEWGGSTIMVPVSAHTGDGIDELLEMVLLTADVMDLKADPNKQAKGTVIEAKLDKNRGPVATVLVQRGTLHNGDAIVTGSIVGRIRAMTDDKGSMVKKAGPSIPVEILGLSEVPEAGELFYAVTDEKVARQLVDKRRTKQREDQLRKSSRMTLETLAETLAAGEILDLNIIVKADVQGSVEAVTQSLEKLSNEEVHVKVIHGGVGAVTESDIVLADVSNAVIIGFNVRPGVGIAEKAKEVGVDIKLYRVIYNAIEDVQAAMKGMLKPKYEEAILGHIEIRQIFKVSNVGTIGGAYVTDGKVLRSSEVRIVRNGIVVHEGKLASLKRFKDDVKEVMTGYECGISIENYNDIKEGDVIEAFEMREIVRK